MKLRDVQKSKVYTAEAVLEKHCTKVMCTMDGLRAYVDKVVSSKRFMDISKLSRVPTVEIHDGGGSRRGAFTPRGFHSFRLRMPKFARNEWYVLHELAHYLVYLRELREGNKMQSHGWQFCQSYLDLVSFFLGVSAHDELRDSFRHHRVRYKKPRTLSPEARARAMANLARFQKVKV